MRTPRHGLKVIGALLALLPGLALATPARMQSLLGNQLFEDDTDLFLYSALTAKYNRSVLLHIGTAGPIAGFIHGGKEGGWQLGAFHNSTVAYDDLAHTASTLGVNLIPAQRIVSFFAGKALDEHHMIGFAINPAFGFRRTVPVGGNLQYQLAMDIEGIFGYSSHYDFRHSDTAVAVSYHRYVQRANPNLIADTPVAPSFALRHRTIWLGEDGIDFGLFGEIARRDEDYNVSFPVLQRTSLERWFAMVGLGPRIRMFDNMLMIAPAVEMVVDSSGGRTPTTGFSNTLVTLPRFRAGAEFMPLEWLVMRAGVSKTYALTLTRSGVGGQNENIGSGFTWSTGLGVRKGGLQVDATISNAILLNGPAFIGGGAPGLFGALSARYSY
jgi:hypothetical protein